MDEENKTKLLRTLVESFQQISMVCNVTKISLNDVVDKVKAEI